MTNPLTINNLRRASGAFILAVALGLPVSTALAASGLPGVSISSETAKYQPSKSRQNTSPQTFISSVSTNKLNKPNIGSRRINLRL